jgi:hypothetical protein
MFNKDLHKQIEASQYETQQWAHHFEAVISDLNEVLKQVRHDLSSKGGNLWSDPRQS